MSKSLGAGHIKQLWQKKTKPQRFCQTPVWPRRAGSIKSFYFTERMFMRILKEQDCLFLPNGVFLPNNWVAEFGIEKACWLSQLCKLISLAKMTNPATDDFYHIPQETIEKQTGISLDKQTKFIKFFKDNEILEVKRKDLPSKNYYRITTGG